MPPQKKRQSGRKKATMNSSRPQPRIVSLSLTNMILGWGGVAAAMTAIILLFQSIGPSAMNAYNSDTPPWEGKSQHVVDLTTKLEPIMKAIGDAQTNNKTVTDTIKAVQAQAEQFVIDSDQRGLCAATERLAAIELRLRTMPDDQIALEAQRMVRSEINRRRAQLKIKSIFEDCGT